MELDPFASILDHCRISFSQELILRTSGFARETEPACNDEEVDSGDAGFPAVESTGILMVSPPESERNDGSNSQEDAYHAPPEGAADDNGTVAVQSGCADVATDAVDLGRDTDVRFSVESEMGRRVDTECDLGGLEPGLEKGRVLKRGPGLDDSLRESPAKRSRRLQPVKDGAGVTKDMSRKGKEMSASKDRLTVSPARSLKVLDIKLLLDAPGAALDAMKESLLKSAENLKNRTSNSKLSVDTSKLSSAKRKLDMSVECPGDVEIIDLEVEGRDGGLASREGTDNNGSAVNEVQRGKIIRRAIPASEDDRRIDKGESFGGKSIEDIVKFRYAGKTSGLHGKGKKIVGTERNDVSNGKMHEAEAHSGFEARTSRNDTEGVDRLRSVSMNIDVIGSSTDAQGVRKLPSSILGQAKDAQGQGCSRAPFPPKLKDVNLSEVLKMLAGTREDPDARTCGDLGNENVDVFDVMTSRGITFPRPQWWPEGDGTAGGQYTG